MAYLVQRCSRQDKCTDFARYWPASELILFVRYLFTGSVIFSKTYSSAVKDTGGWKEDH